MHDQVHSWAVATGVRVLPSPSQQWVVEQDLLSRNAFLQAHTAGVPVRRWLFVSMRAQSHAGLAADKLELGCQARAIDSSPCRALRSRCCSRAGDDCDEWRAEGAAPRQSCLRPLIDDCTPLPGQPSAPKASEYKNLPEILPFPGGDGLNHKRITVKLP